MIDKQKLLNFLYESADDCYQTLKTLEEINEKDSNYYKSTLAEWKALRIVTRQINKGEFDMKKEDANW